MKNTLIWTVLILFGVVLPSFLVVWHVVSEIMFVVDCASTNHFWICLKAPNYKVH
jgi:hypothetical protein